MSRVYLPEPLSISELCNRTWFNTLIDSTDVEFLGNLYENFSYFDATSIRKNFKTGLKKYILGFNGALLKDDNLSLTQRVSNYLLIFETNPELPSEESFGFYDLVLENSYNQLSVRNILRQFLSNFYSFDEQFLEETLNVFDDEQVTTRLQEVNLYKNKECNSIVLYHDFMDEIIEEPENQFEITKNNFKNIAKLYELSPTKIDELIESLKPILSDRFIRVSYELLHSSEKKFKELRVSFQPETLEEMFSKNKLILNQFVDLGLISDEERNDLRDWSNNLDRMLLSIHLNLKMSSNRLTTSVSVDYAHVKEDELSTNPLPIQDLTK